MFDWKEQSKPDACMQKSKLKTRADTSSDAGLPDGIFYNQKSLFGLIWEGLRMKNVTYFMTILNILRPFGIFYGH
jgi:hypothetical protein